MGKGREQFRSVLYRGDEAKGVRLETEQPDFFPDLNLDRFVASVTAGRESFELAPFFYTALPSESAVGYRHEVTRDLQHEEARSRIDAFVERMASMRSDNDRMDRCRYEYERKAWFLSAARAYTGAVADLADGLDGLHLSSEGMNGLREFLGRYASSAEFRSLREDGARSCRELEAVSYYLNINRDKVTVDVQHEETDYSEKVLETFARFRQREVRGNRFNILTAPDMDHIEAQILGFVVRLNPEAFAVLDDFCETHIGYLDETILRFEREVQFYLSILDFSNRMVEAGLSMSYPELAAEEGLVKASKTYDIALADRFARDQREVVPNEFHLVDPERIIVVSGPNQGGKTTFARTVGQLHHLARIGCLVPGEDVRVHLSDRIFTHFEREEDISNLRGKLEDDLMRVHEILEGSTPASVVILNEIFTSTTLNDARLLGRAVIEQIIDLGLVCVYVTFVEELASIGEQTVSMVSTVDDASTASRTFKIVRARADGRAYAESVAGKYGLTYRKLKERLAS